MRRNALALCALVAAAAAPLAAQPGPPPPATPPSPAWKQGGVCYEIFVRSFADSDGDGVGDLPGLISRLDHVNDGDPDSRRDLGATCIWLMPVAQSPSYHGYDVTNYYEVERDYGTNEDFRRLMAEARRRGIRVIVDLVLNHSSSEHPYFRAAVLDPASPYRSWYRFGPAQRQTPGWTVPTWHRVPDRDEWYYGLFWSGMPDLELSNPAVTAEAERIARFWLEEMGADGFRMDAVGHFFEDGDDPRNGPGTHEWLRSYAAFIRNVKPESFTVGEVWDSLGAQLRYYPDQLDAYFAFELSDALMEAANTGRKARLEEVLARMQARIPERRWASFQRNHDQTRTMTVLGGNEGKARVSAALLLTLPGIPFVYYGEEIGMTADKPDPRLRTPMHWRRAPAAGFTTGLPWEPLRPDSLTANVEPQDADPASLLNLYRRLIHLRHATPALGWGDHVPLETSAPGAMAFLRRVQGAAVLVLVNLGDAPLAGVRVTSPAGALTPGTWDARGIEGTDTTGRVTVGRDGVLRAAPVPTLAPYTTYAIALTPAP